MNLFFIKRLLLGVSIVLLVILGLDIYQHFILTPDQGIRSLGDDIKMVTRGKSSLPVTNKSLPDNLQLLEDIWHPRFDTTLQEATPLVWKQSHLQLTGVIIELHFSAAFILDTNTKEEGLYYEGDPVVESTWVVEKINRTQVILRNADNQRIVLPLVREQASSYPSLPQSVTDVPHSSTPVSETGKAEPDYYGPARLDKLVQTTSLDTALGLAGRLSEGTVQSILDKLPQDYLRDKLALTELGLSIEELKDVKPSELITSLIKVAQGKIGSGNAPIYFTSQVNQSDNSPITPASVFTTKDQRIYACFKNEGVVAQLDKIIIYWVNISKNETVYWGCQPIDPKTPYNYVWVEDKSGWACGTYLVALFKNAKDKDCLAQGKFEVK